MQRAGNLEKRVHCARTARGFTLLEILIVLALLVLLTSMAWPSLSTHLAGSQLPEAADRFRSLMYLTRSEAMMQHRRFRIRFEPDSQQPFIEMEPDPIAAAGQYVPAVASWASEDALPQMIHIHDVIPGRPAYLTPVSNASPEDTGDEVGVETTTDLNESNAGQPFSAQSDAMKDAPTDQHRPSIVFEPDGSTDWATVVVSEIPPSEKLNSGDRQYWVILDGRTGLAKVREGITDEELASTEFSIPREKLILPKTNDVKDATLTFNSPTSGSQQGSQSMSSLSELAAQGAGAASQAPEQPVTPPPQTPQLPANPAQAGTMEELEKQLAADPNLTEDEKNQIRQTFQQNMANSASSSGTHTGGTGTAGSGASTPPPKKTGR
ncbi:MAG TPA: GspH/FimT family pseudopilin [Phycisphaerae bacterium]|nr:GspH/FimT family pseudopilin [Phycisphaerae bacterium]